MIGEGERSAHGEGGGESIPLLYTEKKRRQVVGG